jgi:hypothetical protein
MQGLKPRTVRRAPRAALGATLLGCSVLAALAGVGSASAPGRGLRRVAQAVGPTECVVPRLRGLTLRSARARAGEAGCHLRLRGARVKDGSIQTVGRQHPRPGGRSETVTVVVNPLCERSGLPGPPPVSRS